MRFLIADDHPIFRSGLKSLLNSVFAKAYVVEVEDGETAYTVLSQENIDIAILDINMPKKNGLDVCQEIRSKTNARIIILTMHKDVDMLTKAINNGADGFLVKDNTSDEIVECVEAIMRGEKYMAKVLRDSEKTQKHIKHNQEIVQLLENLTPTEIKTLKLVSEKYSSKEIAELLFVSPKSVENYRSRICKKLNLDARNNSLLIWVLEHKALLEDF